MTFSRTTPYTARMRYVTRGNWLRGRGLSVWDNVALGGDGIEVEGAAPIVHAAQVGALLIRRVRVQLDITHVKALQRDVTGDIVAWIHRRLFRSECVICLFCSCDL